MSEGKLTANAEAISQLVDSIHEERSEKQRPHLGPSQLGRTCNRYLWLSFRWAFVPSFNGRMKRLFRRGHREEETIITDLKKIGIDVRGEQTRLSFAPHVSGSIDAVAYAGVPGDMRTPYLLEFKTHSKRSFDELVRVGVKKAKPEHVVQMQCYLQGTKLKGAIYIAVCKDDDRMHCEVVEYDEHVATQYLERAVRIVSADRMPEPISADPTWYQCKFCDAKDLCHSTKLTQEVNCRTCAHSTPTPESKWHCARWDACVPTKHQRTGCDSHVLHPDLVPWPMGESDKEWSAVYVVRGLNVINGEDGYKSSELIANAELCASGAADEWKAKFPGARVVG